MSTSSTIQNVCVQYCLTVLPTALLWRLTSDSSSSDPVLLVASLRESRKARVNMIPNPTSSLHPPHCQPWGDTCPCSLVSQEQFFSRPSEQAFVMTCTIVAEVKAYVNAVSLVTVQVCVCVDRERDERRLIAWFWITVAASSAIAWECCIDLVQSNSQT